MERNIVPPSLRWYAVYTKPRQEDRATSNLRIQNIETCSPKVRETRFNALVGQRVQVIKPLFPSYIFARFDAATMLHKVWFTRGVHKVVSFGGNPVIVADEIIELIRQQMESEDFVKTGDDIALGDKVRIKGGPLSDFVGVFERNASAAKRIQLLLSAVNYQCRIDIDRDLIEKVS